MGITMVHSRGEAATAAWAGGVRARCTSPRSGLAEYVSILENAMAFIPATDCAEAVVRQTLQGLPVVNTLKFRHTSGYDQADIDALAAYIDTAWSTNVLPLQVAALAYLQTDVRGLGNVEDLFATANAGSGDGGITTESPLPANVAFAVKFTTGLTGRSTRGRLYLAGLHRGILDTNENFVTVAFANDVRDAIEQVCANPPAGWQHVVLSYFSDGAPRGAGVTYPVNAYSYTDRKVDTQRRRLN